MPAGRSYGLAATPVRIADNDREPVSLGPISAPPELGADSEAILAELGLTQLA
jgi:crotonobetainyl-CoA:carnitine CoA-transferase CaiB-like acyl-CoA transferase